MAESIKKEEETSGTPHQDNLTKDQVSRYSRQLILPQVGAEGKKYKILCQLLKNWFFSPFLYLSCFLLKNLILSDGGWNDECFWWAGGLLCAKLFTLFQIQLYARGTASSYLLFFFNSRTRCKTFLIALSFNTVPLAFTCAATSRRTYGVMIITLSSPFFSCCSWLCLFFFLVRY